ncbi:CpsD/CapB family tyrosine-protein kinase [Phosphitispora fastidiosa]|uniref:CpsD/CapB family tyrosine-protein kinase n=1 Tax=Phosphitispora fastidiosa TaxID=2837202 RepID=UPI001E3F046B|nr:CpsD/CapB family tyrosine-protein kinase [Phosphitispora fastidiosa]MBU7007214.1 capsular exopolysaccharide synthesis family protein [Phosphitispora fastidiosa]
MEMLKKKVIAEIDTGSPVAEAFRLIRTNLKFVSVDKPFKSVLITSSSPMEGKSETAANLGVVMAQSGVRVIIADCDLRMAEQHTIFGLGNHKGITDFLTGEATLDQIVNQTRIPKLSVVTAGKLPPNPSELLQSEKTRELLSQLMEMCDMLIIDSPPLLIRADAVVLSAMAGGVIMMLRTGRTKIEAVQEAKDRLEKAGARILGVVMNDG